MKLRPGPTSPAADVRRLGASAAAACLLLLAASPAGAATNAMGVVTAHVIEPANIGLPPTALDLYLSQRNGPAGPRTGSLLIRIVGGIGDVPLALQLPQSNPVDSTQELVGGTTILGPGLAMAVMASMSTEEQARADKQVAITIAFN